MYIIHKMSKCLLAAAASEWILAPFRGGTTGMWYGLLATTPDYRQ